MFGTLCNSYFVSKLLGEQKQVRYYLPFLHTSNKVAANCASLSNTPNRSGWDAGGDCHQDPGWLQGTGGQGAVEAGRGRRGVDIIDRRHANIFICKTNCPYYAVYTEKRKGASDRGYKFTTFFVSFIQLCSKILLMCWIRHHLSSAGYEPGHFSYLKC